MLVNPCLTSTATSASTFQFFSANEVKTSHCNYIIFVLVDGYRGYLRLRRQTEADSMDTDVVQQEGEGGFFDRAARFIMDLLQRFLKWVNTDSN